MNVDSTKKTPPELRFRDLSNKGQNLIVKVYTLVLLVFLSLELCNFISFSFGITQPAHDVNTTFHGRCYDFKALKRRRINAVLASCFGWEIISQVGLFNTLTGYFAKSHFDFRDSYKPKALFRRHPK